jgi:hypothetical protein
MLPKGIKVIHTHRPTVTPVSAQIRCPGTGIPATQRFRRRNSGVFRRYAVPADRDGILSRTSTTHEGVIVNGVMIVTAALQLVAAALTASAAFARLAASRRRDNRRRND